MKRLQILWILALFPSLAGAADLVEPPLMPSLLEMGIFSAYGYLPDYPGSDQNHSHFISLPYLIYRGEIVRSDREGAHARLLKNGQLDLELSFGGSFPVSSEDNDTRRGMPDLDWIGEIGPRLSWTIYDFKRHGRIALRLPVRAVFSTNFQNLRHRGYVLPPTLSVAHFDFLRRDWQVLMQVTGNFGNRQLSSYFYDVGAEFSTPQRPAYEARAGYLGTDILCGMAIPLMHHRIRLFNGSMLSLHQGSDNSASPLFRKDTNFTWITAISWLFYQSSRSGTN